MIHNGNRVYILPDRFSIQFHTNTPESIQTLVLEDFGLGIIERHYRPAAYTVSLPEGMDLFETIRALCDLQEIRYACPSGSLFGVKQQGYAPDDSYFHYQWHLENECDTVSGESEYCRDDADIQAAEPPDLLRGAWDYTKGSTNVVLAIIDGGVDLSHPDLAGNLLGRPTGDDWYYEKQGSGCDEAYPDCQGYPGPFDCGDCCCDPVPTGYHGTAVTGVAAATIDCPPVCDADHGAVGVCPECSVLPIKIDVAQPLPGATIDHYADAVAYVRDFTNARDVRTVINVSIAYEDTTVWEQFREQLEDAYVVDSILVVAGAGNDADTSRLYPAAWDFVMAVAATDRTDSLTCYSTYGEWISVAAPGGESVPPPDTSHGPHDCYVPNVYESPEDYGILTTDPTGEPWGSHHWRTGTSVASPAVAAIAGLILSYRDTLSVSKVRQIIEGNADRVHQSSIPGDEYYYDPSSGKCLALGYGRVNAYRAILSLVPPGGACPYLSAWDGQDFVVDNNLLPLSEYTLGDPPYSTD